MEDFAFKVYLVAVVRVRADDKSVARKVVPTVLGPQAPLKSDWPMRTMKRGPPRNGNRCRFFRWVD